MSRSDTGSGLRLRRSHAPCGTSKTALLDPRKTPGVWHKAESPQELETGEIRAGAARALRIEQEQLHPLYQPDPPLFRPCRAPRAGTVARPHKTRAGLLDAQVGLRTSFRDRAGRGGRRKGLGEAQEAGVFSRSGLVTRGWGAVFGAHS